MGIVGKVIGFAIGGILLTFCCVAGAFKIREYREYTYYIKMEINRNDDPNERRYWEHMLEQHYAKLIPFKKKK